MKFYIASSFTNKELVNYVRLKLITKGYQLTYDWTKNQRATTTKTLQVIGENEKKAVASCDIFILLLPAGKGSHTELGMALALDKRVYLYSPKHLDPSAATSFYFVDGVTRFYGEIDEFVQIIGLA
ncbi:nucleoside 2-deoxyribosyltransferase [Lentibacillus sp. N15]|uniref:nucleoside 2-deoxyribosyltransferase n=1 Tax=Lentibacillus songyuanensis TaxID=3136161 RepID=UPI0031BB7223